MTNGRFDQSQKWLQSWPSRLTPLVDVICIPGAGAGASLFKPWLPQLPGYCALHVAQLPGRETRLEEPALEDVKTVVDGLAAATATSGIGFGRGRPRVLFGHSMGAVLAFELASVLQELDTAPDLLIMSATTPPAGHMDRASPTDDELKDLLLAFDPANHSMLEHPELFDSLAPALRADFTLLRRHAIEEHRMLDGIPVHLLFGESDPAVSEDAVMRWQRHFSGEVASHRFAGGHQFPFVDSLEPVTDLLARLVADLVKQRMAK